MVSSVFVCMLLNPPAKCPTPERDRGMALLPCSGLITDVLSVETQHPAAFSQQ